MLLGQILGLMLGQVLASYASKDVTDHDNLINSDNTVNRINVYFN